MYMYIINVFQRKKAKGSIIAVTDYADSSIERSEEARKDDDADLVMKRREEPEKDDIASNTTSGISKLHIYCISRTRMLFFLTDPLLLELTVQELEEKLEKQQEQLSAAFKRIEKLEELISEQSSIQANKKAPPSTPSVFSVLSPDNPEDSDNFSDNFEDDWEPEPLPDPIPVPNHPYQPQPLQSSLLNSNHKSTSVQPPTNVPDSLPVPNHPYQPQPLQSSLLNSNHQSTSVQSPTNFPPFVHPSMPQPVQYHQQCYQSPQLNYPGYFYQQTSQAPNAIPAPFTSPPQQCSPVQNKRLKNKNPSLPPPDISKNTLLPTSEVVAKYQNLRKVCTCNI